MNDILTLIVVVVVCFGFISGGVLDGVKRTFVIKMRFYELQQLPLSLREARLVNLMTACKFLLPENVFKAYEKTLRHFVELSVGITQCKDTEFGASEAFGKAIVIEDVIIILQGLEVLTLDFFKECFAKYNADELELILISKIEYISSDATFTNSRYVKA